MGTTYSIKVVGPVDSAKLEVAAKQRLIRINQLMSTYIGDSEISRLNDLPIGRSMSLSPENLDMLALATKLNQQSDGKFDVTLEPLIRLWGFGADPSRVDVPSDMAIKTALGNMGLDALKVQGDTVEKMRSVRLDFSSIAKGYGVDELARLVEEAGGSNYLVEIGGELRAKGLNERQQVWRIGIETPDVQQRVPYAALPLKDLAMATSGDYRNYFEVDGKRFSHTLDPATGYPITHNLASVTVLASSTALADGYATAISVMGFEAGMVLANETNLSVMVILKTPSGFVSKTSEALDTYLDTIAQAD